MKGFKNICLVLLLSMPLLMSACSDGTPSNPTTNPPADLNAVPPDPAPAQIPQAQAAAPSPTVGNSATATTFDTTSQTVATTVDALHASNMYFVIDGSGSMEYSVPSSGTKSAQKFSDRLSAAKWAVEGMITQLEQLAQEPDGLNVGLYVFDSKGAREVLPLAPFDKNKFLAAVKAIRSGGGTPLGAAIGHGATALAKQYEKQLGYGRYRLVVATDGEANDLHMGVPIAKKNRIPIYTIGFGTGKDHLLNKDSVSFVAADSAEQLRDALKAALTELNLADDEEN